MTEYNNPLPSVDDNVSENKLDYIEEINTYSHEKEVYFAFIDVLGFKKTFDEHKYSNDNSVEFAKKFKEVFEYYFELMNASNILTQTNNLQPSNRCYAGQTSDSLYFYTTRIEWLVEYIKIFLHFNLYSMSKDVFFRGGIAKGNLFIKDKFQFYGDSVIYSYLLESSIAKYPIVMLDDATYNDIKKYDNSINFTKEKEGRYYLNSFVLFNMNIALGIKDKNILKKIDKDQILDNINKNKIKYEYDLNNYNKYKFLLNEYEEYNKAVENHE